MGGQPEIAITGGWTRRVAWFAPLAILVGCAVYDPDLLQSARSDAGDPDAGDDDAGNPDAGSDAAMGECRVVPDAPCPLVCVERCNNVDDDCDGVIDNNGAGISCDIPNAEAACVAGECFLIGCTGDYADCNDDPADGCEVSLTSPEHCGLCGAACTFPNALARCHQGRCFLDDCEPGFDDCDGQPANGCETNVRTLVQCGSCTDTCEAQPNARPTCDSGTCEIAECVGNFDDCDSNPANGCEQALDDPDNCGRCGVSCATLPNATGTCGASGCEGLVCVGDFQNCDGLAVNGCEAKLDQADHCGTCGNVCDLPNVAAHVCDASGSTPTCVIDTRDDNRGCDAGYADCNGDPSDGCERSLNTVTDCGACSTPCTINGAIASCQTGTCEFSGCAPGFQDCNEDGTCASQASDPSNCGTCGNVCTGTTLNCSGGRCRMTACPNGEADCDDNDVCEPLNTASNCGSCGVACPASLPNGTGSCGTGACMVTCHSGFANCDGNVVNGCETDLRALGNCGACGAACTIANATATCASGSCRVAMCANTHRDCDMDGLTCETNITLPTSCGTCGNDCTGRPNTTGGGCNGGVCELTCSTGFRNCDGEAANGCETAINTAANCGTCGNNCSALPNVAMATCTGNGCDIQACNSGFADCDGLPANGCERSTTSNSDCGGCNLACSRANATSSCSTGTCTFGACNIGFGNCDNNTANGCEIQLNTTTHCGACGVTCSSAQICNNGTCADVCPRTYATPGSTRAATRKIKNLTGSGTSSAQFGVGGTDLGIPVRQPDGKIAYIFGDTYDQDTVGGPGWRSPVLLRSEPGLDPSGIVFTSTAGGQYAKQLLDYSHAGGVSWIPSDVITIGSRMYLHYIVGGFANVQWTQIAYSDDNGENWTVSNARWEANENNSLQQLWTWERGCDGYVYVMSTKFSRDRAIIMHRVPETSLLDKAQYEPWGYRNNQWAWGNPASVILDGSFGELSLRRVENRWVLAWFNAGAYEITVKVFNSPTSNLYTASTYHPIRGGAWGAENNTTVAQLFGGYIHPDSTLHNLNLMVSQWNTNTNWPYRVMQFVTGVE